MRRSWLRPFAFLALASLSWLAPSARAEEPGVLTGAIRTAEGSPVPEVALHILGPGGARTIATGPDGRFRLSGLEAGDYAVQLDAAGFVLSPEPRVRVQAGQDTSLDLVLKPAPVREHVVVSATRGEAMTSSLGTVVTVIDEARIAERESTSFLNLMQDVPGASVARSGGVGAQGTVFLRGGASNFARVMVDGVPVNEPGGAWNFGPQLPYELDRVEIVKGAASSLYSTDALAGVIQLSTHRPVLGEAPSFRAEAEAGSFAWQRYLGGTSGRAGMFDWNAGLQYLNTDNQQPNSGFKDTGGALTAGAALSERSNLRLVVRVDDSTLGTPGPTAYGRPDLDASFDFTSVVAGLTFSHTGPRVAHTVRAGWATTHQLSKDPLDSGSFVPQAGDLVASFPYSDFPDPLGYQNNTKRLSAGYQADIQADARNLVSVGADLEHEGGEIGSRPGPFLEPTRNNVGAYVQDRLAVGRLFATLGARVERNASFGTKVVPRLAVAYRLRGGNDTTTLRASAGAGIKEPDFNQSFGTSSFALGNPELKPERSRTFDIGVEQRLFAGRARADVGYFHHDYRDQIAYQYDFVSGNGTYINLGQTRGQGVEVALTASPLARLSLSAEYTYLDGEVLVSTSSFDPVYAVGQPLLRQPKHHGSLSARYGGERFSLGASLVTVGERADSDFVGIGLTRNAGYSRVDARAHARLVRGLWAYVVAENLFDRQYQEVLGYPALGRSVRVGLRFRSQETARP
jgi:outer membrane cobalamin receptor